MLKILKGARHFTQCCAYIQEEESNKHYNLLYSWAVDVGELAQPCVELPNQRLEGLAKGD